MVKHFLTGSVVTEELVIDKEKGNILFPPPQAVASDVHVVSGINFMPQCTCAEGVQ